MGVVLGEPHLSGRDGERWHRRDFEEQGWDQKGLSVAGRGNWFWSGSRLIRK